MYVKVEKEKLADCLGCLPAGPLTAGPNHVFVCFFFHFDFIYVSLLTWEAQATGCMEHATLWPLFDTSSSLPGQQQLLQGREAVKNRDDIQVSGLWPSLLRSEISSL